MGRRLLGAFGAVLAATFGATAPAAPATASAATRAGSVTFSTPPPSLDGSPNADAHEYMQAISVTYDETGTLSFNAHLYDQPHWGANLPPVGFELGKSDCGRGGTTIVSGGFSSEVYDSAGDVDQQASFQEAGFTGSAQGAMSFDGQTFTVTFQNPNLAGLDLRCVELRSGPDVEEPFEDSFYFNGYGPRSLTPTTAQAAWAQVMATHGYSNAAHRYAACPKQEIRIDGPNTALCWAEFKAGRTWRLLSGTVTGPAAEASTKVSFSRHWVRKWRTSPRRCLRQIRLAGRLASNDGACEVLLASDVAYALEHHQRIKYVYEHGTDTAGFTTIFRYRCRKHGASVTCTNGEGDAFRYRP